MSMESKYWSPGMLINPARLKTFELLNQELKFLYDTGNNDTDNGPGNGCTQRYSGQPIHR